MAELPKKKNKQQKKTKAELNLSNISFGIYSTFLRKFQYKHKY